MAYLECINIQKEWKKNSTKIDISFQADKGSLTSIVGQSGSGKSTVLRTIAGLIKSDSKDTRIILDGNDITNIEPGKRECGMVFQNPSLFLNMSVQDNVAYGLCSFGMPRKRAREEAVEFLKTFNMEDFAKRSPETLSGGEAQRVALARTLIVKPKLVLLDEPLSALDANLRKKLAEEILSMQKQFGFTAIMVTHDLKEAKAMSENIILMQKGKKIWEGNARDFEESLLS